MKIYIFVIKVKHKRTHFTATEYLYFNLRNKNRNTRKTQIFKLKLIIFNENVMTEKDFN